MGYSGGRWMRRRRSAAIVAIVAGCVALSACAPEDSEPTPTPTQTAVFASEEEALAAAVDAYTKYLAVSDTVTADGGADPERLREFVADEYWTKELEGLSVFKDGLHTEGSSAFDESDLVRIEQDVENVILTIRVCVDVSGVRLVSGTGVDVTPEARDNRIPLEVQMKSEAEDPNRLLVAGSETWSGSESC